MNFVECSCLSGPNLESVRNFLQLFLLNKEQLFSVMVTYPENRSGWGEVPSLGRPFWDQRIHISLPKQQTFLQRFTQRFLMCMEQGLAGEGRAKAWLLGA